MPGQTANGAFQAEPLLSEADFDRRNEIISLARYGKISPEEAEAEAASKGWKPFAFQPEMPAFDPMRESRWTLSMAIAWIAWRDIGLVRENSLKFSSECWHWYFREWNEATNGERELIPRAGWFLESWLEPTAIKLLMQERWLKRQNRLPPTACMSVVEAEEALWVALGDARVTADAVDSGGKPVDIPAREWSYLKLFEDGKRDILKYDALDRISPYTVVKLKRDHLLQFWPSPPPVQAKPESQFVEPEMYEPVAIPGKQGLVPLCAALHWIMTDRGTDKVALDDSDSWEVACDKLFSFIASDEITLIGTPRGGFLSEQIPGYALATIKVLSPLNAPISDLLLSAPSHIDTSIYEGRDYWLKNFNDQLFLTGQAPAAWTHLQVKKADILKHWPRPAATIRSHKQCVAWLLREIEKSFSVRPKSQQIFWLEAKGMFGRLSHRQFLSAWAEAITVSGALAWRKGGRPRSRKSNH